ncbi:MAG: hypothetical protein WBX01_04545 [Nitrososphaeraceae archaeon]
MRSSPAAGLMILPSILDHYNSITGWIEITGANNTIFSTSDSKHSSNGRH